MWSQIVGTLFLTDSWLASSTPWIFWTLMKLVTVGFQVARGQSAAVIIYLDFVPCLIQYIQCECIQLLLCPVTSWQNVLRLKNAASPIANPQLWAHHRWENYLSSYYGIVWSLRGLLAPSEALYVMMHHYRSHPATFQFSLSPTPQCHNSRSETLLQYQFNWE